MPDICFPQYSVDKNVTVSCCGLLFRLIRQARILFSWRHCSLPVPVTKKCYNNNMTPAAKNREPAKARPGFLSLDYRTVRYSYHRSSGFDMCAPRLACLSAVHPQLTNNSKKLPRSKTLDRLRTVFGILRKPSRTGPPRDDHSRHIIG